MNRMPVHMLRSMFLMIFLWAGNMAGDECVVISQKQAFHAAALVFRGRVMNIEDISLRDDGPEHSEQEKVRLAVVSPLKGVEFKVTRVWKGPRSSSVKVIAFTTVSMGGGYQFKRGEEYIVYALDDIGSGRGEIRQFSGGGKVYSIGLTCPIRIRTDVDPEAHILGHGRSVDDKP